jgi:hypothetical protein
MSMKWIIALTLSWWCDLYPSVRGTRTRPGLDMDWTDKVPIGLFTAIECD